MEDMLPQGLIVRPATMDDIDSVCDLLHDYDLLQSGKIEYTREDVRNIFSSPGVNLEHDTRLVLSQQGQFVGSLFLNASRSARFFVLLRLRPDYGDPRPGDFLLALAQQWARQRMAQAEPGVRVAMECRVPATDLAALERFERTGFHQVRRHWRMEVELKEEPVSPAWPEHIELRPFVPERDGYAVYRAIETAFEDHWRHVPHTFEQWQHWSVERADFDPSLWFIAWEGDRVAGSLLGVHAGQWGWINTLGVLRAWRRRGLGMALLRHAFGEFYHRGLSRAGLSVDSQNLTGAVRLYHRAGMHQACETITYEKELRAGAEWSTPTLAG